MEQDRQYDYTCKRNIGARLRKHCIRGNTVGTTYCECVSVTLVM